jgi:alkylation response protein AidB-like acyl-CoA dehydrogenase
MSTQTSTIKGGEFLITESSPQDVFTPEDFSEEVLMVKDMVNDFIKNRITPNDEQLEGLDIELTKKLMREMGDIGIMGITFPEKYGGSEMDFVTSLLLSELMGASKSMSLSFGANTGIGMLPLLYFGTEEQKEKYLTDLVAGTKCAAYCLTEPGSGSDALAAKSTAVLSADGKHYILNGQKMWITNAGFADIFTVFAKIDGEHFTGFLVEKDWKGFSLGAEEKKLGIKGSSTRQVFFENVKVPVNNLLGEIGKGHKIAFNILNIGRIKLAAGVFGASKIASTYTIKYAKDRIQFGKSISEFGAIQHKMAEQAIRIFVNESANYRAAADIRDTKLALLEKGMDMNKALLGAAEEFAIECALMKVHSSECLDYVVDEGLQVFGGMGYSEESPMASAYRDARINRIFEGTNEINRMLSMDMLLKRGLKGHIDLLSAVGTATEEWNSGSNTIVEKEGPFSREHKMIASLKKAFLLITGATVQQFQTTLATEQEILMNLSDMMGDIYLAESVLLRVEKNTDGLDVNFAALQKDIVQVFLDDATERFATNGRSVITSWATDDTAKYLQKILDTYTAYEGINKKAARRRVAGKLIEAGEYCF